MTIWTYMDMQLMKLNYIQVANCNIKVSAPNDDVNKLKQMFESGVTIWHKNFGDYDQTNN